MNRRDLLRAGAVLGIAGIGRPAPFWASEPAPQAGTDGDGTLWLNWNENPLGPPAAAREAAVAALAKANRYPDADRDRLIAALAGRHGVAPAQVVLGCGSTEILQMIVQAFAAPDALLLLADPTFEAMGRYQRPHGYRMERVPLTADHAHDLERMREVSRRHPGPVVAYVCNPNNPTATLSPAGALDAWIAEAPERVVFAIDEAYHEYVRAPGYRSAVGWVAKRPNVIVTRTFSKLYGMAGLRLGYAFAEERTARRLREFMSSDNANIVALAAAEAALADPDAVARARAANEAAKKITCDCLDELGLAYLPSHANFLMHRVPGELETYVARMRERGVRVGRPFPAMPGHNRLSLGLPEEMERFAELLRDSRRRGWV